LASLNLGILAHVDAGKTSLTERLLHAAGVIDEIGSVDAGSTQTDSLDLERRRGITIKSAVVSFARGSGALADLAHHRGLDQRHPLLDRPRRDPDQAVAVLAVDLFVQDTEGHRVGVRHPARRRALDEAERLDQEHRPLIAAGVHHRFGVAQVPGQRDGAQRTAVVEPHLRPRRPFALSLQGQDVGDERRVAPGFVDAGGVRAGDHVGGGLGDHLVASLTQGVDQGRLAASGGAGEHETSYPHGLILSMMDIGGGFSRPGMRQGGIEV
jgi:hypothetical protein